VAWLEVVGDKAIAGESDLDGGCGHRLELEHRKSEGRDTSTASCMPGTSAVGFAF
jgi:hypothetical protein